MSTMEGIIIFSLDLVRFCLRCRL